MPTWFYSYIPGQQNKQSTFFFLPFLLSTDLFYLSKETFILGLSHSLMVQKGMKPGYNMAVFCVLGQHPVRQPGPSVEEHSNDDIF